MADPYIKQFQKRLRRISKIRKRGGGFEAPGTLGQSYYTRKSRRTTRPVLVPVLVVLGTIIAFKAVVMSNIGPADYLARVEALQDGTWGERLGATIMAPDPLTVMLSDFIKPLVG